jgi:hypothetical protein
MNPHDLLQVVNVATPCPADWNGRHGDDRSRFCGQCRKHVYNLSAMRADDAVRLIQEREGDLCVRLFRRIDGTVLNGDCPIGVGRVWMRLKRLSTGFAAACLVGLGWQVLPGALASSPSPSPTTCLPAPTARELWETFVDDVRAWLGLPPRYAVPVAGTFIMGDICLPPPTGGAAPAGAPAPGSSVAPVP